MERMTKVFQVRLGGIGNSTGSERLQFYIHQHETEGWQAARSSVSTCQSEAGPILIAIVHYEKGDYGKSSRSC